MDATWDPVSSRQLHSTPSTKTRAVHFSPISCRWGPLLKPLLALKITAFLVLTKQGRLGSLASVCPSTEAEVSLT